MRWFLRLQVLAATAALVACRAPDSAPPADSAGAATGVGESGTGGDSARAVRALRDAIVTLDPGQASVRFRVASFVPDTGGYRITLVPDAATAGGGGQAFVSRAGRVGRVEMFQ